MPEENRPTIEEIYEAISRVGKALREVFQSIAQLVTESGENFSTLFQRGLEGLTWKAAENWAARTHPEWVARVKQTKKQRTRTKYAKRILREYIKTL